jgi:hypothetical protein
MRRTILLVAGIALAAVLPVGALQNERQTFDSALKDLKSTDPEVRALAVYTIGLAGEKAAPVSREVIEALNDPNANVRNEAATAITAVNPTLAKPVLQLATSDDADKRAQAVQDLSKLGKDAAAAVPALMTYVEQAKGANKVKAIDALGKVGASDKKLAAQMANWALNSTDPAVRDAALKALPKMADASAQVETATKALQNERTTVQGRLNAVGVLGSLAKDSRNARQALENLTVDPSQQVRDAAKKALEQSRK